MIFLLLGLFSAALVATAFILNHFIDLPRFLAHWFWWATLFIVLVPWYIRLVCWRFARLVKCPLLDMSLVVGPHLALLHRYADLIWLVSSIGLLVVFNWKAVLLNWLVGIALNLILMPLANAHGTLMVQGLAANDITRAAFETIGVHLPPAD